MSICTNCFQGDTVPKCVEQLIIGDTTLDEDTELQVWYEVLATGKTGYVAGIVEDGKIKTIEEIKLPTGTYINLFATLSGAQPNQFITFQIDSIDYTCIDTKVQSVDGELTVYDFTIIE